MLGIWLFTTFVGCMLIAFIISQISDMKLDNDPVYRECLASGLVSAPIKSTTKQLTPYAKRSVAIFLVGVILVVLYASAINPTLGLIDNVVVSRDAAIMSLMLLVGGFITLLCKADINKIAEYSVFKSGMVACICVLGVTWLGDTFVSGHSSEIKELARS